MFVPLDREPKQGDVGAGTAQSWSTGANVERSSGVWGAPAVFRGRMRGLTGANFGRIRANGPCVTPSSVYVAGERERFWQAAGEYRHVERHELASGGFEAPMWMHCLSGFGEAHRLDSTRVTLGRYHAVDG
jgi:hypothetical protein